MLNKNISGGKPFSKYTIEEENDFFKKAVIHMNVHIFVYDIPVQKLYFFESDALPFGVLAGAEHSIQDIIDLDIMEPETTCAFEALFQKIQNGEKTADAVIKTSTNSAITWNHILLVSYFDESGNPIRCVGTIQDVSQRIEIEQLYSNERQFRFAMLADSRRVYEINVTKDRFIKLESIQDNTDGEGWDLYTQSMVKLCKNRVFKDDWDVFLQVATRQNLLDGFENGITEFYCEYRFIEDDGKTVWSSSTTHLLQDPNSDCIKGFIYVKDIDKQKKLELQLYRQAESDPLTGIYNRRTAERLITQALLHSTHTQLHGFLTIDIDEFKKVNDFFGHIRGDFLLKQIAYNIKSILRHNDIFARMGGDEFIVFLSDVSSFPKLLDIANRICESARHVCVDEESDFHTTISIGISTYPNNGDTFAELYKNSDHSLYDVKQHGKNGISLFSLEE